MTSSLWMQTSPSFASLTPLTDNLVTKVCVVGAGIAGLTTAYLLQRDGVPVVLVDRGDVAEGQTSRTTAHLSNAIDDRFVEMERLHGLEGSQLAAESHGAAIDQIEAIVQEEQINCDFRRVDGYLFLGAGTSAELLKEEYEAAHRAGLTEVEYLEQAPIPAGYAGPCLRFPSQGQFHPLKYMNGLAAAFQHYGGQLYTGQFVEKVEQAQGLPEVLVHLRGGASILADCVVVATNSPINDKVAIHTKQAPYITYVIGMRIPKGSVMQALYWDTLDPYHYVRLQPEDDQYDILIVGGEDHKTGQAEDFEERYERLEQWTRIHYPMVQDVAYRWSGQVLETDDGVAFIGKNPMDAGNVFIATGDSGMGMTHGTIAGMLIRDLILENPNNWARLYNPSRKTLQAIRMFAEENLNVAKEYLKTAIPRGEVKSADEIPPGTGAVMMDGMRKVATYRDEQGSVHHCSAICQHLGCEVKWNNSEKTWDCPCHGSRYDAYGKVINGPAKKDLEPLDSSQKMIPSVIEAVVKSMKP